MGGYQSIDQFETDSFCRDLARVVAKHLCRVGPTYREVAKQLIQDATGLYSPHTADLIEKEVNRLVKARKSRRRQVR